MVKNKLFQLISIWKIGLYIPRHKKLTLLQYYKAKLYNIDKRWRSDISYLLSSVGSFERNRLFELISVYMRIRKTERPIHLHDIHHISTNPDILQNSYMFMKTMRGTAAYWKDVLFNLIAMLKNLGCPTLFMTLSANDYHWKELAKTLKVPLENLPKAVQQNPLITAIHFERRWKALLNHVLLSGEQPLGEIVDYFARVEFQSRGSPHLHIFFWVKNAPSLQTSSPSELIAYINRTIHTTIPKNNTSLYPLVKSLQIHNHCNTCKRRNKCRFSFPYTTCENTRIIPALNVSGSRRFYETRRTEQDCMVNAYNPCILLHWQANMDIQMVGGPLGIAYYICSYVCKAEPNILKNALAQTPSNMNTANAEPSMRSRLSKIGFCILKHRGSIPYWKFTTCLVLQRDCACYCM